MISALSEDGGLVETPLVAEDCQRTLQALRDLGVRVLPTGDSLRIAGPPFRTPARGLYCGNSGTTMRLMAGMLAGADLSVRLEGDASLSRRPMRRIVEPLMLMGAQISGDTPPLRIEPSKLHGIRYTTPIPSAQVKSAILLAGLSAQGETSVTESLLSRDHTERMLEAAGCEIERSGPTVRISPGSPKSVRVRVPADISSAAFFLVGGALLGGPVTAKDVGVNPTRTGVLDVLRQAGAKVQITPPTHEQGEPVADVAVEMQDQLQPFIIRSDQVPGLIDEIPILAVLATQCHGTSEIRGAAELRVKESDRIGAIASGLRRMGVTVETFDDGMAITGPARMVGAVIDAKKDHRIGMAFAIAGLIAKEDTVIQGAETIDTSFPGFESELKRFSRV